MLLCSLGVANPFQDCVHRGPAYTGNVVLILQNHPQRFLDNSRIKRMLVKRYQRLESSQASRPRPEAYRDPDAVVPE